MLWTELSTATDKLVAKSIADIDREKDKLRDGRADAWKTAATFGRLGDSYRRAGDLRSALECYQKGIDAYEDRNPPNRTRIYNQWAFALLDMGDSEGAQQMWIDGIQSSLERAWRVLVKQGEVREEDKCGIEDLSILESSYGPRIAELCRFDVYTAALMNNLGVILDSSGEKFRAKRMFEYAVEFTPDDYPYWPPVKNWEEWHKNAD